MFVFTRLPTSASENSLFSVKVLEKKFTTSLKLGIFNYISYNTSISHMEKVKGNANKNKKTSSFVNSLSYLTENSSTLGIRLLALEEYCNRAQNDIKILKTRTKLLSEVNDNTMKTRDELLSRNKTNAISLEGLFNVQFEFYNYTCDVKDNYIRTEEASKIRRDQFGKIITSYKTKWEAVEHEYENLPMTSELSVLEKENILLDAEATRLENLVTKTKADYFEKYHEWWCKLLEKILNFAGEYETHTKFVKMTSEIGQKNTRLQELFEKLQSCEEPQVIRQYPDYFKPIPLVTNNPENGKGPDASKFSFDLTSFDEISIPQDNLEMETEDEPLFNLYENGKNVEGTQNPNPAFSCENIDPKKTHVENTDHIAVANEYPVENCVREKDKRANSNYSKEETQVFDEDMPQPGLEHNAPNVNDKRYQLNNKHLTNDVHDTAKVYSKKLKGEAGVKSVNLASKKEAKSSKLKEKKKETHKRTQCEDKENDGTAPKKGKYLCNSKSAQGSPKMSSSERVLSDNQITFDFGFKENFTHEENQENDKFSFFLKPDSSLTESTSIFKLF